MKISSCVLKAKHITDGALYINVLYPPVLRNNGSGGNTRVTSVTILTRPWRYTDVGGVPALCNDGEVGGCSFQWRLSVTLYPTLPRAKAPCLHFDQLDLLT